MEPAVLSKTSSLDLSTCLVIRAGAFSRSELPVIEAEKENVKKDEEDVETLFNDYKFRQQRAEQNLQVETR